MADIFIYPTDTVWGIGGSLLDENSYLEIARIKQTLANKPLSILFNSLELAQEFIEISDYEINLFSKIISMEATIGVAKSKLKVNLPELVYGDTDFICFRIISNEVIDAIIEKYGPITSTSLNKTRQLPICDADEARKFWKKYAPEGLFYEPLSDMRLSGNSSTIVLFSGLDYKISREGLRSVEILSTLLEAKKNYKS